MENDKKHQEELIKTMLAKACVAAFLKQTVKWQVVDLDKEIDELREIQNQLVIAFGLEDCCKNLYSPETYSDAMLLSDLLNYAADELSRDTNAFNLDVARRSIGLLESRLPEYGVTVHPATKKDDDAFITQYKNEVLVPLIRWCLHDFIGQPSVLSYCKHFEDQRY